MVSLYLSVVIPAYNEEKRISSTLKNIIDYFNKQHYNVEIIVINDGSSDKTADIVESYTKKSNEIKLINLERNSGKAAALKAGFEKAQGEYILFSDADLSTPIEELENLFDAVKKQKAQIAIASRGLKGSKVEQSQPFYRVFMGKAFNLLVQIFAAPGIWDTQCGFKLFEKEAGKKLFSSLIILDYSFDVEIIAKAIAENYKIAEVPVRWINSPDTKLKVTRDVPPMFISIFKVFLRRITGRLKESSSKINTTT